MFKLFWNDLITVKYSSSIARETENFSHFYWMRGAVALQPWIPGEVLQWTGQCRHLTLEAFYVLLFYVQFLCNKSGFWQTKLWISRLSHWLLSAYRLGATEITCFRGTPCSEISYLAHLTYLQISHCNFVSYLVSWVKPCLIFVPIYLLQTQVAEVFWNIYDTPSFFKLKFVMNLSPVFYQIFTHLSCAMNHLLEVYFLLLLGSWRPVLFHEPFHQKSEKPNTFCIWKA